MKSPYVSELQPNQTVTATFLVQLKDVRQKKTGEPYLSLILGDRTGDLDAKMWDNVSEILETFERDDFIKVKGLVQIHRNQPQLQIHKLAKVREVELDFADFFPSSERSGEVMFAELQEIAAGIRNPHLHVLVARFLADEPLMRLYRLAPAAKSVHHAFLGGLLEHVLSLCKLAKMTAAHYPFVDVDLVLTGVILHDVGKVVELTYDRSFGYSSEGQLLGHIVIGLRMLTEKLAGLPDFPPRLRTLVEHLIVSHHGELEYGSPKTPLFPEAMLLHHLDNLDSKMECMRSTLAKDKHATGAWTSYNSALDRAVLKMARFLDGDPEVAPAPAAPVPVAPAPPAVVKPVVPAPAVPPPQMTRPLPAPPPQIHSRPQPASVFAEKLKDAWKKG
jgi:3'-5' exoribonuclease